jgi:hypothetical protein
VKCASSGTYHIRNWWKGVYKALCMGSGYMKSPVAGSDKDTEDDNVYKGLAGWK